ncbi:Molybdenum ABC transporter permease protein ModB [hydrothermal vent metagenome]|uniref:Molybdenum ABC transporter permease protein ModB n=1 Tax=hydrothermal vent metagenome TaxID=652676 RepID=A0A3B1BKZ5_9ZZZZ
MLSESDIAALWITFRLALVTTLILLLFGTPLAWWLAHSRGRLKVIIEAVVSLPLVLPPTVLGFYLLILLGAQGPIGSLFITMGGEAPVFRFSGLVIGSVIYSLPFVVQPLRDSFAMLNPRLLEAAATLHASPLDRFFSIAMPQARHGFLTASVLGFAHTVGEFGVVLMIGGNIPGQTQVLSIAIYDHVESLEYAQAHWLAGGLLILSFVMLLSVYTINQRLKPRVNA